MCKKQKGVYGCGCPTPFYRVIDQCDERKKSANKTCMKKVIVRGKFDLGVVCWKHMKEHKDEEEKAQELLRRQAAEKMAMTATEREKVEPDKATKVEKKKPARKYFWQL